MFPDERRVELKRIHAEIEQDPQNGSHWYDYADFLVNEWHDYPTAILVYKKIKTLAPNNDLRCLMGNAYSRAGEYEKGLALIRAALKDKLSEYRYSFLGMSFLQAKDYKHAQEAFQQSVAINPQFEEAHYFLGKALEKCGEPHKAHTCYEEAIRLDPTYAPAWSALGRYLERHTSRLNESIEAYKKAVELEPTHGDAKQDIAHVYWKLNQPKEADEYFQSSIADFPQHAGFRELYAEFLKAQGKEIEAQRQQSIAHTLKKEEKTMFPGGHYVALKHFKTSSVE